MPKNQDYGQQFKKAIENALSGGDFDGLNRLVEDALETTVTGAFDQIRHFQTGVSKDTFHATNQPNGNVRFENGKMKVNIPADVKKTGNAVYNKNNSGYSYIPYTNSKPGMTNNPWIQKVKERPFFKKLGNISGTLLQVFGGVGTAFWGLIFSIVGLGMIVSWESEGVPVMLALGLLTGLHVFSIVKGSEIKTRSARSERYYQLSEKNGYCNISELAASVMKDEKFVLKELKKLIANGAFPQGHIDDEGKCFILTDAAYAEYRKVIAERRAQGVPVPKTDQTAPGRELTETEQQLQAMVAEGREYIAQIRQKNDEIPGEVFSQKLYRMEDLLKEIFLNLEKKPNQMSKMHRLMNYYLPTTLKLVSAYEEFDKMSVQGADVTDAKKEIENTVDTINDAFGEILNKLFSDTAMDVTTDAQVLKTILAREGLTKDNLTNQKEEKEYVYELR